MTSCLVDASVLSEPTKPAPAPKVVEWLRRHEKDISVDPIILGEVRFGIELLPRGKKRAGLDKWFAEGVSRLRCVPWDAVVGLRWASLLADLRKRGAAMPLKDSMIAATALALGLTLATRNIRDFKASRVTLVNPFD